MFFFLFFFFLPMVEVRNTAPLFVSLRAREGILTYACEIIEFIQVFDEYVKANV